MIGQAVRGHGIIPARYASTRLEGKPLLLLDGKPMFWHVWERARKCAKLATVTLATDDDRIFFAAKDLGVPVVMTSSCHQSGSDRVYEAACALQIPDTDIIINIQGDEPALQPEVLTELLGAFEDQSVRVATLAHTLELADMANSDKVKVVRSLLGDALYFSRSPIPFVRKEAKCPIFGHIGLYAFTKMALATFVNLPMSPLEETEKLEQLRFLENGIPIRVIVTKHMSRGIDSSLDIAPVLELMRKSL